MDRRHLSLARDAEVRFDLLIPADTEALLLVEQEAGDAVELVNQMHELAAYLTQTKRLAYAVRQAFEPDELELFWHLVDRVQPSLSRLKGRTRAIPVADDMAVPPEILPDFLLRVQNVLKRQQITAALLAHAGHGELYIRPLLDLTDADDVESHAPARRGTLPGSNGRRRFDHRRAGLWPEPHFVPQTTGWAIV